MKAKAAAPPPVPVISHDSLGRYHLVLALAEIVLTVTTVVVLWKYSAQFSDVRNILLVGWLILLPTACIMVAVDERKS